MWSGDDAGAGMVNSLRRDTRRQSVYQSMCKCEFHMLEDTYRMKSAT